MKKRTMRRAGLAGVAAAAALLLAACASADEPQDETSPAPTDAATEGEFPVTVEHMFGEVTIDEEPQRIVTVGPREHELLYSLGVAPVAVPESWQGWDYATGPWAEEARQAVGAEPETFPSGELNIELIASYEPDLIIGTYAGLTDDQYAQLSAIAPTLAQSGDWPLYGMPLDEEMRLIGAAVGREAEAEAVLEDIDARFAAEREAHPDWEGKTGIVAFVYDGSPGAYHSTDTRNQFLANLGLTVDGVDEYVNDQFYIQISAEQLDLLGDFDTILWQTATTPEVKDTVESLPLFGSLSAAETGGHVWITETVLEGAFFANSPSSIEFSLDAFIPQLEQALDGDPSTEVAEYTYAD